MGRVGGEEHPGRGSQPTARLSSSSTSTSRGKRRKTYSTRRRERSYLAERRRLSFCAWMSLTVVGDF